ncbi:PTS glucose transporter subunit IIA [Cellulomonas sp. APG4]|uniref:PTS sugar transporter subunit IIA n=1 Tax=Cellulomonas sp. APG4 TaxID=1538656 RepID=UPI001379ABFA|nr:PTS glucose transporter subunit IIA [Cellulomonas sp. APG4]
MPRRGRPVLDVVAPMAGTAGPLADVEDPVFAGRVLGPGVALAPLEPEEPERVVVVAPCAGRVVSAYPHAVVVQADDERSVLVHVGTRTAPLVDDGFALAVRDGEWVAAGHPVLAWTPGRVRAARGSTLTPVVALQARPEDVAVVVADGDMVGEGQLLLRWS